MTSSGAGPRPRWWPLAVISSAHLMAVLDTTIMFVALPSIQQALHMTVSSRQWVVTAYTLALAGLLLLGGRLADKFGARRTLIIGVAGFAVASAVGGASVDGTMLIVARAVQGAFGAVLTSSTRSLLVTTYRGEQRATAISLFTATLTAGLGVGLVLGGVITSALGWRWCLYLNLVFSVFVVLGAPRFGRLEYDVAVCVPHTDHGSHFRSGRFVHDRLLRDRRMMAHSVPSPSRGGIFNGTPVNR